DRAGAARVDRVGDGAVTVGAGVDLVAARGAVDHAVRGRREGDRLGRLGDGQRELDLGGLVVVGAARRVDVDDARSRHVVAGDQAARADRAGAARVDRVGDGAVTVGAGVDLVAARGAVDHAVRGRREGDRLG